MFNAELYVSRQHPYRPLPLMQINGCVQEIEQHKHLINEDELWYEASNETSTQGDNYTIGNARVDLLDIEEILRESMKTLFQNAVPRKRLKK